MASPFDRLMESVRPFLPGALDIAMKQELFTVCQDFFRDSCVWQECLDFTLPVDTYTFDLMPFTGRIERLLWVLDANGIPVRNATMPDPDNGTVLMPLASPGDYKAQVVLNASDPVSRDVFPIVPYNIMARYWEVIMHGLIAHMQIQPNKPYSSPQLAAVYQSKFQGGIARARNEKKAMYRQDAQPWTFPQSFNRTKRSRR